MDRAGRIGAPRHTSRQGIAEKAKRHETCRCRHRYGRLTAERLKECWRDIRQDAAYSVDAGSAPADEQALDEHVSDLGERLQRKRYRAKRVRRPSIPTGDGQVRPVGRPAVEDKLLQWAVTRLRTAISAPEFRRGSEGYRPHLGALDAVDKQTIKRPLGRSNGVGEAARKGCFATSEHAWMIRMLAAWIEDRGRLRLIKKGLKAGVLDTEGQVRHPVTGTPPGGISAPMLAHVSRHEAVERWVEKVVTPRGRGEACLLRYADDGVGALERQEEAEHLYTMRSQRRGQFGLELAADKTRGMPFSRQPPAPKTSCEVLGFECRGDKDRAGQAQVTRRTARKKRCTSLQRCTPWDREHRHLRLGGLCARLTAKLRGYDNDDGVPGNVASLKPFFSQALGILQQGRTRRRQRRSSNWAGYTARLAPFKIDRPRLVGRPQTRMATSHVSAGWRTRVDLKSPVRANRTPGSVRGRSGNWPSYRDDVKDKNREDAPKIAYTRGGSAMNVQSHVAISADGIPIHYEVQGNGATALVFVHGWCCNRRFWDRQVGHFAPHYTVVSLDLAGHGASGRDRLQWTATAFGQDVVAVVEQLGLKQVVLIGHSSGGQVIVEAARRLPRSVIGLVGADTWPNLEQPLTPAQVAATLAPFRTNFVEAMRTFARNLFVPTSDPALMEHVAATMSAAPPHIAIGAREEGLGNARNLQAGLQEVKAPKITINAESWRPTNMAAMQRYGIEVVPMSRVGHCVMMEDPQTFNRLMDEAVKKFIHTRAPQEGQKPRVGLA